MDCSLPGSSALGDSPGKNTGVGCPPPGDLPNPGIKPRSPTLRADSLPAKLPGMYTQLLIHLRLFATPWTVAHQAPLSMGFPSKNIGVGCHFLLHRIFPSQRSNLDLLHCRWILYHLSQQRSPSYKQYF